MEISIVLQLATGAGFNCLLPNEQTVGDERDLLGR